MIPNKKACIAYYKINHGMEKFNQGLRQVRQGIKEVPALDKDKWEGTLAEVEYRGDSIARLALEAIRDLLKSEDFRG